MIKFYVIIVFFSGNVSNFCILAIIMTIILGNMTKIYVNIDKIEIYFNNFYLTFEIYLIISKL